MLNANAVQSSDVFVQELMAKGKRQKLYRERQKAKARQKIGMNPQKACSYEY